MLNQLHNGHCADPGTSAVSHRAVTDGIKHTVTQIQWQCYACTRLVPVPVALLRLV